MRAFVIKKYAHPSKIPLEHSVLEPQPGPGQVLIDVYSAGLNFYDVGVTPVELLGYFVAHCGLVRRSYRHKANTRSSRRSRL